MSEAENRKRVVDQFGFQLDREYGNDKLAARVLEMPDTGAQWFISAAVTLADAFLSQSVRIEKLEGALREAAEDLEYDPSAGVEVAKNLRAVLEEGA